MTQTTQQETDRVDIFMPIYIGDYLKDTNRLSTEHHGAYLLLLFDYWQHGHIPDDDSILCRITRMTPDAWSNARSIIQAYFKHEGGKWIHSRVERELQKAKQKKANFSERGKKGNEARWGNKKNPSRNPSRNPLATKEGIPNSSPSPSPSPTDINKDSLSVVTDATQIQVDEIATHYNSVRGAMPSCVKVTDPRRRQIKARIDEVGFEELKRIISECKDMPHLQGDNDRSWKADLEWITKAENFTKIREGRYKRTPKRVEYTRGF